jgi:hypothetical protein
MYRSELSKGAASFTIYSSTKEHFRKHKYLTGDNIFDVAASGAVGGALAGALITFGSVRESSFTSILAANLVSDVWLSL